jgi:DNA-binding transcriptional LysR family regulator
MDRFLVQFLAIAEVGGISKAARALNVTQPTMTFNLKKLESTLGVDLFIRGPHGMELTPYGEILRDHARLMQRLKDNAEINIEALKLRNARALRIGCGDAWWIHFAKDMIADYAADFPLAPIHVDVGSQLHGMEHLLSGDIDLCVAHRFETLSPRLGVIFVPLFEVRDKYYVREGHPLAGRPCTMEDMSEYDFVDTVPYEIRHQQIYNKSEQGEETLLPLRRTLTSNSFSACIELLTISNGIMIYPEVMTDYLAGFGIVPLEMAQLPRKPVGIYQMKEHAEDKRIGDIIERLRKAANAKLPRLFDGQ